LLGGSAPAATVSGVLLDHLTGYPLSRSMVRLEPLPGSPIGARVLQTRSGRSGQFQFLTVPAGQYRVTATRTGYFPAATARPLRLSGDDAPFVELRAHRVGAITGTVLDENGIGVPGATVVAYPAQLPLRVVATAKADDRGVFRIAGLTPGKFWVRSAAHTMEDGAGLLPTFTPQARQARDSRSFPVRLDADTPDADIRPDEGNLVTLTIPLLCTSGQAILTLTSETTRHTVTAPCGAETVIRNLAPGSYELLGVASDGRQAAYWSTSLAANTTRGLQLTELPTVMLDAPAVARRLDPYEASAFVEVPERRAVLLPGTWEFRAAAPADRYAEPRLESILPAAFRRLRPLSSEPGGRLEGRVKDAPGSFVMVWAVLDRNQQILGGPRQTIADVEGRFAFPGLPPGDYRLMASYDQAALDSETLVESHAVNAGQTTVVEVTPRN
jgi:hypothetical protein